MFADVECNFHPSTVHITSESIALDLPTPASWCAKRSISSSAVKSSILDCKREVSTSPYKFDRLAIPVVPEARD